MTGYPYRQTDKAGNQPPDPQEYPLWIDVNTAVNNGLGGHFHVSYNPDNMNFLKVAVGRIDNVDGSVIDSAGQDLAVGAAPSGNPRHDLVYIDITTGVAAIAVGAEAGTPVDPVLARDQWRAARLRRVVGKATVDAADIDDLRSLTFGAGGGYDLLESYDVPSPVAIVDFTVGFDDLDYAEHLIVGRGLLGDNAAGVLIGRARVAGTWQVGTDYEWTIQRVTVGSGIAANQTGGANVTAMQFAQDPLPTAGAEQTITRIWITGSPEASAHTEAWSQTVTPSFRHTAWSRLQLAAAVDGFRLRSSVGNLIAGSLYHYGLRG